MSEGRREKNEGGMEHDRNRTKKGERVQMLCDVLNIPIRRHFIKDE